MSEARDLTIDDLLSRISLQVDLESACSAVVTDYQLGQLEKVEPLYVGHSELNTKITTSSGQFLIKFFNKKKDRAVCQFVADSLHFFQEHQIPVPELVPGPQGNLYELAPNIGQGFLIVMKFFVGQTFNIAPPSLKDKLSGVKCLARLNLLKSTQDAAFDPWLLIYLADEYDKNHHLLSAEDDELVRPIVEDFRKVDLTQFSIGMVHYDLHRDNIQKDSVGNVCLFDMETIGNGYPIVDLATYIGLTCLEPEQSVEENQNIYQQVLSSYTAIKTLSPVEHSALETLTKAIFASNVVAANYLIKAESDNTKETYKWYDLGKKLLQKLGSVSLDQGSLA